MPHPCSLITAIGIGPDGKRRILGCRVQFSAAETHWQKSSKAWLPVAEAAGDLCGVVDADEAAEASLLRLASAVLSETGDDWKAERAYLTMDAR